MLHPLRPYFFHLKLRGHQQLSVPLRRLQPRRWLRLGLAHAHSPAINELPVQRCPCIVSISLIPECHKGNSRLWCLDLHNVTKISKGALKACFL